MQRADFADSLHPEAARNKHTGSCRVGARARSFPRPSYSAKATIRAAPVPVAAIPDPGPGAAADGEPAPPGTEVGEAAHGFSSLSPNGFMLQLSSCLRVVAMRCVRWALMLSSG